MPQHDKIPFRSKFDVNYQIVTEDEIDAKKKKVEQKYKTGTTTVGLVCKDGVVLAADKRATMQFFVASKTAQKIHEIQPYLYMTIAGGVADAQYLIELLKAETELYNMRNPKDISVKAAANLLSNILYQKKGWYQVGLILGGATEEENGLYDVGGYGSILPEKFCSVGSGSPFALGVLEAQYSEGVTVEKGMDIAAAAVRSAVIRDIASGNGIDVVGIKKDGVIKKNYSISEDPLK